MLFTSKTLDCTLPGPIPCTCGSDLRRGRGTSPFAFIDLAIGSCLPRRLICRCVLWEVCVYFWDDLLQQTRRLSTLGFHFLSLFFSFLFFFQERLLGKPSFCILTLEWRGRGAERKTQSRQRASRYRDRFMLQFICNGRG